MTVDVHATATNNVDIFSPGIHGTIVVDDTALAGNDVFVWGAHHPDIQANAQGTNDVAVQDTGHADVLAEAVALNDIALEDMQHAEVAATATASNDIFIG